jgi:hypothetical protein
MTAPKPERPKSAPIPTYAKSPFAKQTSRAQAVYGKLLEDNIMCRVLKGSGETNDLFYDPKFEAQSNARDCGRVRRFGDVVGRLPLEKAGTRAAASGSFPSNWRPTAPPNDSMTRPSSASTGVKFERQITRKQGVNGKLLENLAMTRFLFGVEGNGPEYYEKAKDSMLQPLYTSARPKLGIGQHRFQRQSGRLPINRCGTRAAANGIFPSHWEPGMGYSDTIPKPTSVTNMSTQPGRVELHLSGLRGAPPNPALAADYVGPERPKSAMQVLREGDEAPKKPRPASAGAAITRPIPERLKKHIEVHSFQKQMTREQWCARPIRI